MDCCYCNEDQGAGYTFSDEHGRCEHCKRSDKKTEKELKVINELLISLDKYSKVTPKSVSKTKNVELYSYSLYSYNIRYCLNERKSILLSKLSK